MDTKLERYEQDRDNLAQDLTELVDHADELFGALEQFHLYHDTDRKAVDALEQALALLRKAKAEL